MSELALAPQHGLLSYIVGSVTAPRATVRQLMQEPRIKSVGWQLVLLSATVSVLSSGLSSLYEYLYRPDSFTASFLPPDYLLWDILLSAAVGFGLFIGTFLLIRFLWAHLFGYRDQVDAVWAAAVMSCCFAAMLDPLSNIATLMQGADIDGMSLSVITGIYLVITILIMAVYFSASLLISYLKALAPSLCTILINVIAAGAVLLALMMPSYLWIS